MNEISLQASFSEVNIRIGFETHSLSFNLNFFLFASEKPHSIIMHQMEKMKVVLDYNLNLESNESCLFDKFNIATNVPLVASVCAWKQCDQMVKIIFQYLAICNNEN